MPLEFYELTKVTVPDREPGSSRLSSASVMACGLCGKTISGCGGPGSFVCIECGDVVKSGEAKGAIKWDD